MSRYETTGSVSGHVYEKNVADPHIVRRFLRGHETLAGKAHHYDPEMRARARVYLETSKWTPDEKAVFNLVTSGHSTMEDIQGELALQGYPTEDVIINGKGNRPEEKKSIYKGKTEKVMQRPMTQARILKALKGLRRKGIVMEVA